MNPQLILVQGLFAPEGKKTTPVMGGAHKRRAGVVAEHGTTLGVLDYEWLEGTGKRLANRLLRLARGTARAVDAVEIIALDENRARASLADRSTRDCWRDMAGCAQDGFDPARSFFLLGKLRQLVDGPVAGQRVLWFGRGLDSLTGDEFVAHYTGHHGPLVAGNAQPLGVRRYRQVASEQHAICDDLRELGLGQASPPLVFAELAMGSPSLDLATLRARRSATREIKVDEKRHIDFGRSMLLLV